MRKDEKT